MPFTIAHSVTARPIARLSGDRLLVSALAVGAMAPDFEYLAHLSATRTIGHTFAGVFVLCLPAGLLALLVWYRLLGPALVLLLRPGTGGLTASWAEHSPLASPARVMRAAVSIVVGSFSHLAWDAITHEGGAVVSLWSGFSHRIGPHSLPVYQWLQYGFSLFGLVVLGVWALRAARHPAPPVAGPDGDGAVGCRGSTPGLSRHRRAVVAVTAAGLFLVGAVGALRGAGHGDAYDAVKGGVIGAMAGVLIALVLASGVLTRRRRRA